MKNLTITLDDETYAAARVAAAKRSQSVSALVRSLLATVDAAPGGHQQRTRRLFDVMDAPKAKYSARSRQPREALYARQS